MLAIASYPWVSLPCPLLPGHVLFFENAEKNEV